MLYYSNVTKALYDTVEELEAAEKKAEKAKDERKAAADAIKLSADKVTEAYDAYKEACKEYDKLLAEFCEKYGSYKTTVRSSDIRHIDPLSDLLNFTFFHF